MLGVSQQGSTQTVFTHLHCIFRGHRNIQRKHVNPSITDINHGRSSFFRRAEVHLQKAGILVQIQPIFSGPTHTIRAM